MIIPGTIAGMCAGNRNLAEMRVSRGSRSRGPRRRCVPPSRMAKRMVFSMAIGVIELDFDGDVVAGHDHFDALGELDGAGHVRGAEVELRAVVA